MATTPVPHEIGGVSSSDEERRSYAQHVNPIWVKLLDSLGMNVQYTHCSGAELYTEDGRTILDCLSGYCVHNVGHNHPHIVSQLIAELQSQSTAMIQSNVVEAAGALAQLLCRKRVAKSRRYFSAVQEARGSKQLSSLPALTPGGQTSSTPLARFMD